VPRRIALRLGGLPAGLALVLALVVNVGSSGAEAQGAACPPVASTTTSGAPSTPSPAVGAEPAPEQTLACVGTAAITGATYSHWLAIAKNAGSPAKGQHALNAKELLDEVMSFLISSDWVQGEAADLSIIVTSAQVKKNFDRIRAAQFHKRREFRAFLRKSGETVADLLHRVELNLLSARIQKRVVAGHHGPASQLHALHAFVKAFKAKWEPQTYCASEYDVKDCGHVEGSV
jgi:hypothetical protein